MSCDTYGAATGFASSRYMLNSASYGWWMSDRLYEFNDPDGMVFEGFSPAANLTRLLSGVVAGTVFLSGDDLSQASGQARDPMHAIAAAREVNVRARRCGGRAARLATTALPGLGGKCHA